MLYKKLISLGIATVFTVSTLTTSVFAMDFEKSLDKEFKNYSKNHVSIIANKYNKSDSKDFKKNASISKIKAMQYIIEMIGLKEEAQKITGIHPLYTGKRIYTGHGYIYLAIENNILLEEDLVNFNPITPAKRYEIAKYIIRAIGMDAQAQENMNATLDFADADEIPVNSIGYVYLMNKLDLIDTNGDNFQPNKPITNGEMEKIIEKAKNIEVPDIETVETDISVFVSLNDTNTKISVKLDNDTDVEYSLNPLTPVYVNNQYSTVSTLKAGDELKLTFSNASQVIFIEVITQTAPAEKLVYSGVEYESLPDVLKTEIDNLKLTSNYKAFKYENQIYLVATRGQQNTGGYGIDLKDVYKIAIGDSKYDLKAVVELTDPASDVVTTQVVTYPYSIIKIDSFEEIQNINFNDVNNNNIFTSTLSVLDVIEVINGTVSSVDASNNKINATVNNITTEYIIPLEAIISVNTVNSQLSDISAEMKIVITKSNNIITSVIASDNIVEGSGTLLAVSNVNGKILTVKVGNEYINYLVHESTVFISNEQNITLDQVPLNSVILLKQVNGILKEVKVQ